MKKENPIEEIKIENDTEEEGLSMDEQWAKIRKKCNLWKPQSLSLRLNSTFFENLLNIDAQ